MWFGLCSDGVGEGDPDEQGPASYMEEWVDGEEFVEVESGRFFRGIGTV